MTPRTTRRAAKAQAQHDDRGGTPPYGTLSQTRLQQVVEVELRRNGAGRKGSECRAKAVALLAIGRHTPSQLRLGVQAAFDRQSPVGIEPVVDIGVQFVGRYRPIRCRHAILRRPAKGAVLPHSLTPQRVSLFRRPGKSVRQIRGRRHYFTNSRLDAR